MKLCTCEAVASVMVPTPSSWKYRLRQNSVDEKPAVVMMGAPLTFASASVILIGVVGLYVASGGGFTSVSVAARGGGAWATATPGAKSARTTSAVTTRRRRLTGAPCCGSGPARPRGPRNGPHE